MVCLPNFESYFENLENVITKYFIKVLKQLKFALLKVPSENFVVHKKWNNDKQLNVTLMHPHFQFSSDKNSNQAQGMKLKNTHVQRHFSEPLKYAYSFS